MATLAAAIELACGPTESQDRSEARVAGAEPLQAATAHDLHHAARIGDLEAMRAAVLAGADVNEVRVLMAAWEKAPQTPLFIATHAGNAEVVRYLLEAGADPDIRCTEQGTALTIAAARYGTVEILRLLLDAGADVLGPRPKDRPALAWSALNGDSESFLLLLDASRRAGTEPEEEASILASLQHRHDELRNVMKRFLTWRPENVPLLHVAARNGLVAEVQAHLAAGAVAAEADEEGWTALHWASYGASIEMARLLLAAGADPNAMTKGGCTPLMLAARSADTGLAVLLLEAGAEADTADEDGRTALHVAAMRSAPEMIWLLLERGADPERTLLSTQTPMMLAEARKWSRGIDVRWAFDGRTPPAYATEPDQVQLAIDGPAPVMEVSRAEVARDPKRELAMVDIHLKLQPFTLDLAFDVFWRQGQVTLPVRSFTWQAGTGYDDGMCQIFARSVEPGYVELLLRPSRALALRELPRPTAIWGDEVVLRCELIEKR